MKNFIFTAIFLTLLLAQVPQVTAQTTSATTEATLDLTGSPQWVKDFRRFDIIAFGIFPFSWFIVNTAYDMYRWYNFNGMGMGDLRYAPWPIKSAGAVEMTNAEYRNTILMAAGLSLVLALTDFIIIKIKREKQRHRIESRPAGSVIINRKPYPPPDGEESREAEETAGSSATNEQGEEEEPSDLE